VPKVTNTIVISASFCNLRFSESGYFYFFEANFEALRNSSKQTVHDYHHRIRLEHRTQQIWSSRWNPSHIQGKMMIMYIQL